MQGKTGNDKERGLHECVSGYVLVPPAQINCTLFTLLDVNVRRKHNHVAVIAPAYRQYDTCYKDKPISTLKIHHHAFGGLI